MSARLRRSAPVPFLILIPTWAMAQVAAPAPSPIAILNAMLELESASDAKVVATAAGGLHVLREIQGGSGYLSQNPKELHFGTGRAAAVDLEVTWPNGDTRKLAGVAAGHVYRLRQGGELERVD